MVCAVMENLEKSQNFDDSFPGLEKSWKSLEMSKVKMESHRKMKYTITKMAWSHDVKCYIPVII